MDFLQQFFSFNHQIFCHGWEHSSDTNPCPPAGLSPILSIIQIQDPGGKLCHYLLHFLSKGGGHFPLVGVERGLGGEILHWIYLFWEIFSGIISPRSPGYCNGDSNEGNNLSNINFSNFCLFL